MTSKIKNFFEIAGNTCTYAIPGIGQYLHYHKIKKIEKEFNEFRNNLQETARETKQKEKLGRPLKVETINVTLSDDNKKTLNEKIERLNRLEKSEKVGKSIRLAMWIILFLFVFSFLFSMIAILIDFIMIEPVILSKKADLRNQFQKFNEKDVLKSDV